MVGFHVRTIFAQLPTWSHTKTMIASRVSAPRLGEPAESRKLQGLARSTLGQHESRFECSNECGLQSSSETRCLDKDSPDHGGRSHNRHALLRCA